MRKQITVDQMLRKSANHDAIMWRRVQIGIVFIGLVVLAAVVIAGCAPRHDEYLAVRFAEFNETVQDGLADCRVDPNACRPTLELMAGELEVWTDILTDPNL